MAVGYSGTPLVRKLGIKPGQRVAFIAAPDGYAETLGPLPDDLHVSHTARGRFHLVQLFARSEADLRRRAPRLQEAILEGGALWVSWPKKSSGVATDLTEDRLRDVLLPTGWVDVKVCAVDETWSGLKFMRRTRSRAAQAAGR